MSVDECSKRPLIQGEYDVNNKAQGVVVLCLLLVFCFLEHFSWQMPPPLIWSRTEALNIIGCKVGTTTLHKWTVTAGNVDVGNANCWGIPAAVGEFWLDLTGSAEPRTMLEQLRRMCQRSWGHNYRLSFFFGGNPQCLDRRRSSQCVLLNESSSGSSINVTGAATNDAQWHKRSIIFAAKTSPTVLSFQSLKGVNPFTVCGPLLDGVSIVAIQ